MLICLIVFFVWLEIYSISIALIAKKDKIPKYGLCIIPFAAFFFVDTFTQGFKILTIPVKKWGVTVLLFVATIIIAYGGCVWSANAFPKEMAEYFKQIMLLPICACLFLLWLGVLKSTIKMLNIKKLNFKYSFLIVALLLPTPFLLCRKPNYKKGEQL